MGINDDVVPVEGLEQCVVSLHPVYQLAPVLRGQGFQTIGVLPKIKLNSCMLSSASVGLSDYNVNTGTSI